MNNVTNSCPDGDTPICLVGLRPFIGAKRLIVSGSHLVLLATAEQETILNPTLPLSTEAIQRLSQPQIPENQMSPKWTVYSLTLPSSIGLHKDMMQLANMNRTLSPHGYFQLLCESHMILRTALHVLAWRQQLISTTWPEQDTKEIEEELKSTKEKYQETCFLLANIYVLSHVEQEWKLALPYYRMCEQSAISIIRQTMESWINKQEENFNSIK